MTTAQFSIQLASPAEGPILGKISSDSFLNDRHTQMKGLGKDPYDLEKSMTAYLSQQAVSPRTVLLKAVDNETGDIAGWVLWGFRGFAVEETAEIRDAVPHAATQFTSTTPAQTTGKTAPKDQAKKADIDDNDPITQLEKMTDADMKAWMTKLMPDGTKCMYVSSLCVATKWQSKGVGSALLQWGTKTADVAGVFIWVHSSANAWEMYAKYGFKIIGTLDVDLDQYAPAPAPDNDGKWGHYVFRYMKREPSQE
ncbi:Acyl-CoA N-acyltransferase [Penicillium cf. viridicatum]|uniref:Acyl-CoA N-acyltransferase n=1 Tax=Penicillium cf. viridicatum TaxID=2972119 RepID=A0A9W9JJ92_9EURO|nr:Acyl-CoA N-acyltransferase [Penicillium cf. viridicatum]